MSIWETESWTLTKQCLSVFEQLLNKQKINPEHFCIEIQTQRKVGQPFPFTGIHLKFKVSSEVPIEKLERAILLSKEKYCSVFLSLHPEIIISHEIDYN